MCSCEFSAYCKVHKLSGTVKTANVFVAVVNSLRCCSIQEKRKKEREVEEKRLAAERAAEEERRKAAEVDVLRIGGFLRYINSRFTFYLL